MASFAKPYCSVLTRAIESYAREHGYPLISASSDENSARHDLLVDRLMEQRIDALIVVPPRERGRDWNTVPPPIPIVFIDRPVELASTDAVIADNAGGAQSAVAEPMIRNGARRIAWVGDDLSIYTMQEQVPRLRAGPPDSRNQPRREAGREHCPHQ